MTFWVIAVGPPPQHFTITHRLQYFIRPALEQTSSLFHRKWPIIVEMCFLLIWNMQNCATIFISFLLFCLMCHLKFRVLHLNSTFLQALCFFNVILHGAVLWEMPMSFQMKTNCAWSRPEGHWQYWLRWCSSGFSTDFQYLIQNRIKVKKNLSSTPWRKTEKGFAGIC